MTFLNFISFAFSEFLLALLGSSVLILFISHGSASASDATDALRVGSWLVASCDRADCDQGPEECQGNRGLLFNWAPVSLLSFAPRLNDNSLTDIAGAKLSNAEGAREPSLPIAATNGKWPIRYMNAATDAAEQNRAEALQPHWSHLPIWGPEAAARGHRIPPPFGIGVTYYHARQPVNVSDLKLGVRGGTPQSISDFAQVGRVDSTQQNVSSRFDVWLFPFLNLYGVVGYTTGNTKGAVSIPEVPILGLVAQDLPLRAEFKGPTYGGGVTLGGGFRITEWRDLHTFIIGDVNHTITRLSFVNESLIAHTKPEATVASFRLGLRGEVTESIKTSIWVGAMYQRIQEEVAGSIAGRSIEFIITQRAAHPWNTLVGGQIELGKHFNFIVEGGIGPRSSILTGATFRF